MKKFVLCLSLAWKLMLVLTLTAHGQSAPVPTAPPSVALPPTIGTLPFCNSEQEQVFFSNLGNGTVNAVCFGEGQQSPARPEVVIPRASGVTKIFPLSGGDFYAVSGDRVYRYYQYPYDTQKVRSWRIFGGIPFNPDQVHLERNSDGYEYSWQEIGLSFRFPWEKEGSRFALNGDGTSFNQPITGDSRMGCVSVVTLGSYEYCLDPKTSSIFRPDRNPFASPNNWSYGGTEFFVGRKPIEMVAGPDRDGKEQLYVSLAGEGRIVALGYDGGRSGNELAEKTILYNFDIISDMYQNRLAVTKRGMYFINRAGAAGTAGLKFRDEVWFLSFKTNRVTPITAGQEGEMLSGLAVAQSTDRGGRG